MRVIAKSKLRELWERHPDTEHQLKTWYQEATNGSWESPEFIRNLFPNCRTIKDNRVIFNIKGNHYRLIVKINYKYGMIYVRFIGTHSEYDKIDPLTV